MQLKIAALKRDLGKYRIDYDVWFHESTLHESGAVLDVVNKLLELGACYKAEDGAIMYRSAQYAAKYGTVNKKKTEDGTEEEAKDEVLVRANGIPTYFAADIAYHYNKLATRGFAKAIDVWGADHHGHVARMKGAMDAIGLDGSRLDIVLMQMVNLMRDGKPVRMSKRTGKAITLTDLLDEVPIDSARFFFNQRESSSTLDFDLDLAVRNDSENPVYYVQYAHARICSVLKKLESEGVKFEGAEAVDASVLTDPAEQALIRLLAAFPAEIAAAAEKYDPARITRYCIDVASAYHRFYIDEIYQFITHKIIFGCISRPIAWWDRHVVDGFFNFLAWSADATSDEIRGLQSGRVQQYALVFLLGALALILILLL